VDGGQTHQWHAFETLVIFSMPWGLALVQGSPARVVLRPDWMLQAAVFADVILYRYDPQ